MNLKDLIFFQKEAERIAKKAGAIIQNYREKIFVEKRKSDFIDIVTNADLASEEYIINELRKKFPKHNILSEEKGSKFLKSDFTWVIDPLDGTRQFARGLTFFNVSIALEYKGEIIVGVVFVPSTGELFSAAKNQGTTLNGKFIHVSYEKELKNALIWMRPVCYKNSEEEFSLNINLYKTLAHRINRFQPFTEDVKALCGVAQGGIEGFLVTLKGPNWWDVAPGVLMVEEAGGKATDFLGKPVVNRDLTHGLVASNGKIHQQLLQLIKH